MDEISLVTRGKINRKLHITGRREDGYHLIDSLFQPLALGDGLVLKKAKNHTTFRTNEKSLSWNQGNLCKRALDLLEEKTGEKFYLDIILDKKIPLGAGLAGGTANGAGILKGVNALYDLKIPLETLKEWALALGADFPYCLEDRPLRAQGIGEILTPVEGLVDTPILLLNPGFQVDSKRAYSWYDALGGEGRNHLERGVSKNHPEIQKMMEDLKTYGAYEVSMTGSGPTVYGLFHEDKARDRAAKDLKTSWPLVVKTRSGN